MNSDVSFHDSEPGPAASMPGESALLPAAVPPGRARGITSREYRQGMVVTFDGRRWEIDSVEFWLTDQKLHLRDLDGAGRVRTREEWARNVEFEGAQPEPAFGRDSGGEPVLKVCPNCGKLGSESHLYDEDLHYGPPAWTCKRPEPDAPINGSTPIGEFDPDMQLSAAKMPPMPEPLHLAWLLLDVAGQENSDNGRSHRRAAVALRSWWRNTAPGQAQ